MREYVSPVMTWHDGVIATGLGSHPDLPSATIREMSMTHAEAMTAMGELLDVLTGAQRTMTRLPSHMAEHLDLHPSRLAALSCIQAGGSRVTDVAEASLVSVSAASRTVDVLVDDDLVARERDPDNRRAVILTLTPAGSALMEVAASYFAETFLEPVTTRLGDRRTREVAAALADFTAAVGQRLDEVQPR